MQIDGKSPSYMRRTAQHHLGAIILYRLLNSSRFVTDNPADADLFMVPLMIEQYAEPTAEDIGKVHEKQAPAVDRTLGPVCNRLLYEDWFATLTHMTPHNVHRHILINPEFFSLWGFCSNIEQVRKEQDGSPNVELLQRFGHVTNSFAGSCHSCPTTLVYPSCVHLSHAEMGSAPWRPGAFARRVLMMYGGSTYGTPFASRLRRRLVSICKEAGSGKCALITAEMMEVGNNLDNAYEMKAHATFCLEPPGFGPERKSMVDALHLGCIPVLFSPEDDAHLWPGHWPNSIKADTRVLIDGEQFLSGQVDVLTTLERIPAARIAAMQQAIGEHAHRMHYSRDDVPGDALEVAFDVLISNRDRGSTR